jgi:uncharacterized membrane protein YhhN
MSTKARQAALSYAALAVADTVLATRPGRAARAARFVTKPLLMPMLSTAFVSAADNSSTVARGTSAAHAFSWGGDVALLGKGDKAFLAGLSSFLLGHISYVVGFANLRDRGNPWRHRGVKAGSALALTAGPVIAYAAGRREPGLRAPVAAYSSVLATMFATSTMLDPQLPARARRTVAAGTGLFLVSDTILGAREFLLKHDSRVLDGAVMATYTAGQGLIAAGVAEASRARAGQPV